MILWQYQGRGLSMRDGNAIVLLLFVMACVCLVGADKYIIPSHLGMYRKLKSRKGKASKGGGKGKGGGGGPKSAGYYYGYPSNNGFSAQGNR